VTMTTKRRKVATWTLLHHRQIDLMMNSSAVIRYRIIPTPVIDSTSRARWMRRSADRQAAGRHARSIGTKNTRPRMATGMPKITDCGLWVTFSQLKVAFDTQASAFGWKWVMVR